MSRRQSLMVPARVDSEELLDEMSAPLEDVLRSLRDLRRFNRYLGGVRAYRRLLGMMAGNVVVDILDLGSGSADLPASIAQRGRAIALDLKIEHLHYGRRPGDTIMRVAGDARYLPFAPGSVDVVLSSHFFHHFGEQENVALIDESLRVARTGVIVTDTRRHLIPYLFTRLLSALRLVGRITRYDAPASVMRGYTVPEVCSIAARTVAGRWRVVRIYAFRFGLLLWK